MAGRFCADEVVCSGGCVLAAVVGFGGWGTLAFEAALHRLWRSGIGEAVERASQKHDCQETDDDLKAALHL